MDEYRREPGCLKNPWGNLSSVMVIITDNAGRIRILPISRHWGKKIPQINAIRKIIFERYA